MSLKNTHDIKDFAISFGGQLLSGFGEDAAVSIEYQNQRYETTFGVDGEATRMRSNADLYAIVTITLRNSSNSNNKMNLLAELDRAQNFNTTFLTIYHAKGGEKYVCEQAYVQKQPDAEISGGPSDREWIIECPRLVPSGYGLGIA